MERVANHPSAETENRSIVRQSPPRLLVAGALATIGMLIWSYGGALGDLAFRWANDPDYSHGFLVPLFALYLLWFRRELLATSRASGTWWGLAFLAVAAAMRWLSNYFFYPLIDGPSLIPCLAGVTLLAGGWAVFRWAWPAIAFLAFMMPLPGVIAGILSHPLQRVATLASTSLLQVLGVPAISRGNVIWLTSGKVGVVEACSGLSMLMLFLAITVGASFLVNRPLWEKCLIAFSALGIGVASNILRITSTAILCELVGEELANKVFHDLAGWLMMPVAVGLLMVELYILSRVFENSDKSAPMVLGRSPARRSN